MWLGEEQWVVVWPCGNHVTVAVRDLDRSFGFYMESLGASLCFPKCQVRLYTKLYSRRSSPPVPEFPSSVFPKYQSRLTIKFRLTIRFDQ